MNKNIKIAKELVRIAKNLVAVNPYENFSDRDLFNEDYPLKGDVIFSHPNTKDLYEALKELLKAINKGDIRRIKDLFDKCDRKIDVDEILDRLPPELSECIKEAIDMARKIIETSPNDPNLDKIFKETYRRLDKAIREFDKYFRDCENSKRLRFPGF